MSKPEILRRCAVCGAASRPGAMFCPQCGNAAAPRSESDGPAAKEPQGVLAAPQPLDPRLQTRQLNVPESSARSEPKRMRRASTVVLNEAGSDPSARFVLVAAILFVLFLVLLVLSKMIT